MKHLVASMLLLAHSIQGFDYTTTGTLPFDAKTTFQQLENQLSRYITYHWQIFSCDPPQESMYNNAKCALTTIFDKHLAGARQLSNDRRRLQMEEPFDTSESYENSRQAALRTALEKLTPEDTNLLENITPDALPATQRLREVRGVLLSTSFTQLIVDAGSAMNNFPSLSFFSFVSSSPIVMVEVWQQEILASIRSTLSDLIMSLPADNNEQWQRLALEHANSQIEVHMHSFVSDKCKRLQMFNRAFKTTDIPNALANDNILQLAPYSFVDLKVLSGVCPHLDLSSSEAVKRCVDHLETINTPFTITSTASDTFKKWLEHPQLPPINDLVVQVPCPSTPTSNRL